MKNNFSNNIKSDLGIKNYLFCVIIFVIVCMFAVGCGKAKDDNVKETENQKITADTKDDNVKETEIPEITADKKDDNVKETEIQKIIANTEDGDIVYWFCAPVKEKVNASDLVSKLDKSKPYDFYCDKDITKYSYDELEKTVNDLKKEGYSCYIFEYDRTQMQNLEFGK